MQLSTIFLEVEDMSLSGFQKRRRELEAKRERETKENLKTTRKEIETKKKSLKSR